MATIHIDGIEYQVKDGDNLLQACLSLGLDLPYFCWHPAMGSIGACRQCAVVQYQNAEDQRGRIVMGCMTPVTDGAIFSLSGDKAQGFRESVVESLMLNHPHDCPVCAEGGECHLQDMTVMVGHRDRSYRGLKNTHRNQNLGPLINHEMNRCITCYRCTRYYNDYAGGTDLAAMASHDHVYFGRHEEGVLQSEFAGNLVEVCPTGVFTDKTLVQEYTRKWDLQSAPSLCTGCGVGCNTLPGERYGKLKRVHNRFNDQVNGYFLCDRGRFGASFVNHEKRLDYAGLRNADNRFDAINQEQALQQLTEWCSAGSLVGIGSPRASVETNFLLQTLVGNDNFCAGFSNDEQILLNHVLQAQQQSIAINPDIKTIESADAILILGEDPTNTAPRIALALRQSVRNKAYAMAAELKLAPWQDAAVRNLAQDQLCPLFIASSSDTRLDDIAEGNWQLAPATQTRFALDIANALVNTSVEPLESDLREQSNTIAKALRDAQRPLIIAGTGSGNTALIDAAATIANTLATSNPNTMLSLTVPEANSIGQTLLSGPDSLNLSELSHRAKKGEVTTLLVVENDLYRRGSQTEIDNLLSHIPHLIVLDQLDNPTLSASHLALPAASFIESEGTLVNMEYRAQRHFPLTHPAAGRLPSWKWLLDCLNTLSRQEAADWQHFDDISLACETAIPALVGISTAAPDHLYRNVGVKIPRQPHRYSGRTAMNANVSLHEPKQTEDNESALSYSMEGLNSNQPGSLLPYVWSPGWNSNQSLHKFQSEVGGPLKGGTAGSKIQLNKTINTEPNNIEIPPSFSADNQQWLLVPKPRIFGSDELSAFSKGLQELIEPPSVEISSHDAEQLGVADGDGLVIGDLEATLEVNINDSIAAGCVAYSAGFTGTFNLSAGKFVTLNKAADWKRRRPQIIGSDGGNHV
jgi:NADH-quinone oxidoreductase subunit G